MKKRAVPLATEDELLVDLTFLSVPASLLTEFEEKVVRPYFGGNLNQAIQDLLRKALAEQDFVFSHITAIRESVEA
jgi:hypothetical protein